MSRSNKKASQASAKKPKTFLSQELGSLRSELAKAEKAARRTPTPVKQRSVALAPLKPQRESELDGIDTDEFALSRAHASLREAVYDSRYSVRPHAVAHARAEGFTESDIVQVLVSGRVRAIYALERRWLVCGYFETSFICLPLHVVVYCHKDGFLDIVTAFIPKRPHHIISRARLAVMLRYDEESIRARTSQIGNRLGYKNKGRWKRGN